MKVLLDYWIFDHVKTGGIYRYYLNLVNESKTHFNSEIEYLNGCLFAESEVDYKSLGMLKKPFRTSKSQIISKISKSSTRVFNQAHSVVKSNISTYDIFHPTYFSNSYNLKFKKKPIAITIYDMIHEQFPTLFSKKDPVNIYKENMCKSADIIFAISNHTKNDIIKYFNIPSKKIMVTYLDGGFDPVINPFILQRFPKKYILYVGQRDGYKNFTRFLKAIRSILLEDENIYLLCTGRPFSKTELENFEQLRVGDKIVHHFATDNEFYTLYNGALAFVYPSLYEGFGIPILEAFGAGCPVLASNTSSLAEIAGDGAVLFDPLSETDIHTSIKKVIYDDSLRKTLIQKGKIIKNNFSWKKTMEQTLIGYNSIL